VLLVLLANRWVINSTDAYLYADASLMPENEVGLVLGCSPFVASGKPSPQFRGSTQGEAEPHQGKGKAASRRPRTSTGRARSSG
jgi:SanA protein